jgi:uncharacterized Zn finger protein (UPF0148 family)
MKMRTNNCPCCGSPLLRHARQGGVYWFCTSCWQEVPLLATSQLSRPETGVVHEPVVSANS